MAYKHGFSLYIETMPTKILFKDKTLFLYIYNAYYTFKIKLYIFLKIPSNVSIQKHLVPSIGEIAYFSIDFEMTTHSI